MSEEFSIVEQQVHTVDLCHPYAKLGLDALISSFLERYMMSEARFDNDD
jgi:hypothetical protein